MSTVGIAFPKTGFGGRFSVGFTSATSVTVTHNAGTTDVVVMVRDNGSPAKAIIPEEITMTDVNTVTLTFAVSQSGRVTVLW